MAALEGMLTARRGGARSVPKRRVAALLAFIASTALLSGCAQQSMPSYETARADTIAAMQRIVDELPEHGDVWKRELSAPAPCGDGYSYSATWGVTVDADFDIETFVLGLDATLGDDFERVGESPTESIGFYFDAPGYGDAGVGVTAMRSDDGPFLDLLGTSRCARAPTA